MTDTSTAEPLSRLVSEEEIRQCRARSFRHMDRKEWDAWGQVFAAVSAAPEGARTVRT